jgi:hypothetical protein
MKGKSMRTFVCSLTFVLGAVFGLNPRVSVHAEILPAVHEEYNASLRAQVPLEEGWANPPRLAQTRVWWWWLNSDNDKETITRDLEAMKANGIGGANLIDAGGDDQRGNRRVPHGPDFASKEWRELFIHAMAEADRLGLEMGFNIQSGWNLGGPTVTVEESSKRVTFSKTSVRGEESSISSSRNRRRMPDSTAMSPCWRCRGADRCPPM